MEFAATSIDTRCTSHLSQSLLNVPVHKTEPSVLLQHLRSFEQLREAMGDVVIDPDGLTRDDWLDLLMTHRIQPSFPVDTITVIHEYPASQAALARVRSEADGQALAERFELYLGPLELANGYHELGDAQEQRTRFERDSEIRHGREDIARPTDHHLLDALNHGFPDCAGVALGVDRLLMAMLGTSRIADALAFDFNRARMRPWFSPGVHLPAVHSAHGDPLDATENFCNCRTD